MNRQTTDSSPIREETNKIIVGLEDLVRRAQRLRSPIDGVVCVWIVVILLSIGIWQLIFPGASVLILLLALPTAVACLALSASLFHATPTLFAASTVASALLVSKLLATFPLVGFYLTAAVILLLFVPFCRGATIGFFEEALSLASSALTPRRVREVDALINNARHATEGISQVTRHFDWTFCQLHRLAEACQAPSLSTRLNQVEKSMLANRLPTQAKFQALDGGNSWHEWGLRFEDHVCLTLKKVGIRGTRIGKSGDGGTDILIQVNNGAKVSVQCKRLKRRAGKLIEGQKLSSYLRDTTRGMKNRGCTAAALFINAIAYNGSEHGWVLKSELIIIDAHGLAVLERICAMENLSSNIDLDVLDLFQRARQRGEFVLESESNVSAP